MSLRPGSPLTLGLSMIVAQSKGMDKDNRIEKDNKIETEQTKTKTRGRKARTSREVGSSPRSPLSIPVPESSSIDVSGHGTLQSPPLRPAGSSSSSPPPSTSTLHRSHRSSLSSSSSAPTTATATATASSKVKNDKNRYFFHKEITEHLKKWIIEHRDYPYPTEEEKKMLGEQTGLSPLQITNWMVNARRRIPSIISLQKAQKLGGNSSLATPSSSSSSPSLETSQSTMPVPLPPMPSASQAPTRADAAHPLRYILPRPSAPVPGIDVYPFSPSSTSSAIQSSGGPAGSLDSSTFGSRHTQSVPLPQSNQWTHGLETLRPPDNNSNAYQNSYTNDRADPRPSDGGSQ